LKDRILMGARRRVDLVGRKIAQPLDGWNVVVGSCPGNWGFREKRQKAVRAPDVRSQAPEPVWMNRFGRPRLAEA